MLENIRESSQGLTAKIILGFIILTFAVAGIGSYTNTVDSSVAQVNGQKISKSEFDKAYQQQRGRMAQQFGDMFDTLAANSDYMANFRTSVLDNLINEKLIDQSSSDLALRVSDDRLKQTIRDMKEFHVDGVFDNNRYLALINQAGFFQSSDFRDYLRTDMVRRQLSQALVATEFNLPYQQDMFTALQNQQRDIRFATIGSEQFKADITIDDEQINNYYLGNQQNFENSEKVKVDYLRLDMAEIAKGIAVTGAEIETYYNDNIANYTEQEQRRLAHILIEFGDDEAVAKSQAEDILARIGQGDNFEALAKELSNDIFSGENGGDLDWTERGVMDAQFDDSAFALASIGDISAVVKTSFGYHIIKLTDLKAASVKALADISDEIKEAVSAAQAQDMFFELQQQMAQLSFEFPDSLDDAASAVDLSVQTSPWLSRSFNQAPFDDNQLISAAFSDLILTENVNSDVIEVNDELVLVMRLNQYQPANVKPLTEVQAQIKTILIAEQATEKAQFKTDELLQQLKDGTDISEQLTQLGSSFTVKAQLHRNGTEIDQSVRREAFVLPHPVEGEVSASSIRMNSGDLAIVQLQAVKAGEKSAEANLAEQQVSQLAQSAYRSYVESLKVDATITRKQLSEPTQAF